MGVEYIEVIVSLVVGSGTLATGTVRAMIALQRRREKRFKELAEQAALRTAQLEIRVFMLDLFATMARDRGASVPLASLPERTIGNVIDARPPPSREENL